MRPEVIDLRIVEGVRPNGSAFFTFYLGRNELGQATKSEDGWMVGNKRKPLPTEVHAAKAMIDMKLNDAYLKQTFAKSLMNDLRLHNGGTLPSTK